LGVVKATKLGTEVPHADGEVSSSLTITSFYLQCCPILDSNHRRHPVEMMAEGQCGRQFFGDAFDIDHVIIDRCFSSENEDSWRDEVGSTARSSDVPSQT